MNMQRIGHNQGVVQKVRSRRGCVLILFFALGACQNPAANNHSSSPNESNPVKAPGAESVPERIHESSYDHWESVASCLAADQIAAYHVEHLLEGMGIPARVGGSRIYQISVPAEFRRKAESVLIEDAWSQGYWLKLSHVSGESPENPDLWPVRQIVVGGHLLTYKDLGEKSGWTGTFLQIGRDLLKHDDFRTGTSEWPWIDRIVFHQRKYILASGATASAYNITVYHGSDKNLDPSKEGRMDFQWLLDWGVVFSGGRDPR